MGSFFSPKIPSPPQYVAPVQDVPSIEDTQRQQAEADALRQKEIKRKGLRSTILTGTGLAAIEDTNLLKKTLLGG